LYCGRVIGAFRLLRDSEFCSDLHREKYGERLGKALHEIAAPAPAPAGVAGFRIQMPFQRGNLTSTLTLEQTGTARNPIRTGSRWPLTIDTDGTTGDPLPAAECAPVEFPARSEGWMPAPAPEPVAAFVQTSAALTPAHASHPLRFAAGLEPAPVLYEAPRSPSPCDHWMPAAAPEPVATFVQASAALAPAHTLRLPCPASELEPLPAPDEPLAPPALCPQWMAAPAADPVSSYLAASTAPAVAAVPQALRAPAFALSIAAAPHVPWVPQALPVQPAEPVMATVRPSAALVPIRQAAAIALPAIPQAAPGPFAAARPASPPAREAVEGLPAAVPVSMERAPSRGAEPGAPTAISEPTPQIGKPVASPAPAAAESMLVPSAAAPMAPAARMRMLPFALAPSQERTLPGFDAARLAPPARQTDADVLRLVAPQPIAMPAVTPPATARRPLESALPHPGLLPLEFHSQRLRSVPVARPEWRTPHPTLLPPRFLLNPVLEKPADPAPQQKTARKEPGFVELPNIRAAKRPPTVLMVAGRVAAGFLLGASLWYGVANFHGNRGLAVREEVSTGDAALSAANSTNPAQTSDGETPAAPAPKGPVAWIRQTLADRASLKIAENFRGMENWHDAGKALPAGWSRHPDGYMNTGALALFRPSLKFADYHMEFFGQIETKSIGWTVRATDTMNYHAVKLTVVEAGMRPFVALVHYNVVGGKSGHRTQTPLNLMVHNNRPMQFAVDVRGNRVVTSIDGEEVDAFIDNTLVAGGVGFFSEEGERARLYWMSISRNDDWLGHVCATLAGEAGLRKTAGLRGPQLPGGAPSPRLPASQGSMTLAAVWFGLPYPGATRRARILKTWRSEPWNT
jgi:hypothetical protein